ncbi:MAG: hypothetical protein ACYDHN_15225 [Solirubrobacteraceae bacterium]
MGAALCSLAIAASPALAGEFVSSGGPSKGKGEEQEFKFGPFNILCLSASAKGGEMTPLMSTTFATSLKFKHCTTEAKIGGEPIYLKTKFLTPLALEYHNNGFAEAGSELEEKGGQATLAGGSIELKINSIKCLITLPEQTIPRKAEKKPNGEYTAASYYNEPETKGKRSFNKLLIENEFSGLIFEFGEGQCEEFKLSEEERKNGKYFGEILEEVPHGNLEYAP